jgi:hypothetical protein
VTPLRGGCLCGFIRYEVSGPPYDVSHCHCADCRRSSGAPLVTWASVKTREWTVVTGELATVDFATRRRSFCPRCGTQLLFSAGAEFDEIAFTVATLDEPAALVPTDQIWTEDKLPWIHLSDGLPEHRRNRM